VYLVIPFMTIINEPLQLDVWIFVLEIDHKQTFKFCMKCFSILTITYVKTARKFGVMSYSYEIEGILLVEMIRRSR
jgi:hypothetical protein